MMLGAGSCQVNAIRRLEEMGHTCIASDNLIDSPGKKIASIAAYADTFSYEDTLKEAKRHEIEAVMTTGTDQPVLTAALVAKELGLPFHLSVETAKAVTDKRLMKRLFTENNIPCVPYAIISENFKDTEIAHLNPPYVVKPVDSQGQRGILKLDSPSDIRKMFKSILSFSREKEILVEEYYKNSELCISGWVTGGRAKVLTISDRVTFSPDTSIGVCISHEYPSVHMENHKEEIIILTQKICTSFGIK